MGPPLRLGQEKHRADLTSGFPILRVLSNSDNLETGGVLGIKVPKMLPDRAAIFEEALGERLIHHGYTVRCGSILVGDAASLQNPRADTFEISITGSHPGSIVLIRTRWRQGLSLNVDRLAPVIALHRGVKGKTDLTHARDCREIVVELAVERRQLIWLESCHVGVEMEDVSIGGLKSEVLMLHVAQALRQQARGAQKNEGQRRLRHHQRPLRPPAGMLRGTISSAQSVGGIGMRHQPCRGDSEENSRQQRNGESKGQHRYRRGGADGHMLRLKSKPQEI